MSNIIRFEQASLMVNEASKIKVYETRFFEVLRMFQKSPFMQMTAWNTYEKLMDLHEPVANKDWSNYLFKKLDEAFEEVENYQNDPKYQEFRTNILEMIEKCKILNIL